MISAFGTDLDFELFEVHNSAIAQSVALAVLMGDDQEPRTMVLSEVQAEYLWPPYRRFLFEAIVEMIRSRGSVDIEQLRERLVEFASRGSPEFVHGCLANLDQILGLGPTSEHVEKALQIMRYDRSRKKAQGLLEELLITHRAWDRQDLPGFEEWLQELSWAREDIRDVTEYFGDHGEKIVWRWVKMGRLGEDTAEGILQILRAMQAF